VKQPLSSDSGHSSSDSVQKIELLISDPKIAQELRELELEMPDIEFIEPRSLSGGIQMAERDD